MTERESSEQQPQAKASIEFKIPFKIINCHTHIFTHEHVPQHVARGILPFWGNLLSVGFARLLIRLYRPSQDASAKEWEKQWRRIIEWYKWKVRFWLQRYVLRYSLPAALVGLAGWLLKIFSRLFAFVAGLFFGTISAEFLQRFFYVVQFSLRRSQKDIFDKLCTFYPDGSRFVVLPMDMEFMAAGRPRVPYRKQLAELERLMEENEEFSERAIPFVFADPRREEKEPGYFEEVKRLIESKKFQGIKIYPALGYYPFDEKLLDLYRFACENEVPVMTHCIRGTIFYRDVKKTEWDHHPILMRKDGKRFKLSEYHNKDFTVNFTHPLNYECLLNERLVERMVENGAQVGGLTEKMKGFRDLKICLGHFGGEDEWLRHLNADLERFDNVKNPEFPLDWDEMPTHWNRTSWFALIRRMLYRYDNVYADLSFILYEKEIFSLLNNMLNDPGLRSKLLFGTDFYVVRQKASERKLVLDLLDAVGRDDFKTIAVVNPQRYLSNKFNPIQL